MMYTAQDYQVFVGRDRVTSEFVAIVREFPSLSWISEDSRPLAARGMRALLSTVLTDIYDDGGTPPAPLHRTTQLASTEDLRELAAA